MIPAGAAGEEEALFVSGILSGIQYVRWPRLRVTESPPSITTPHKSSLLTPTLFLL